MNWSSLIVFFALGLIGLWVAYSFLNKKGLYLFSLLALVFSILVYPAVMFEQTITMNTVLMPLVYLSLLTCYKKYGKEECTRMFTLGLIVISSMFIVNFLQSAYMDASSGYQIYLTWENIGRFISTLLAFVVASIVTFIFANKVTLEKTNYEWVRNAIYLTLACVVDGVVFTVLSSMGIVAFGSILLNLLIKIVLYVAIAIALGFFEKYLNRHFAVKVVEHKNKKEEANEESKEVKEEKPEEDKKQVKEKSKKDDTDEDINYENI